MDLVSLSLKTILTSFYLKKEPGPVLHSLKSILYSKPSIESAHLLSQYFFEVSQKADGQELLGQDRHFLSAIMELLSRKSVKEVETLRSLKRNVVDILLLLCTPNSNTAASVRSYISQTYYFLFGAPLPHTYEDWNWALGQYLRIFKIFECLTRSDHSILIKRSHLGNDIAVIICHEVNRHIRNHISLSSLQEVIAICLPLLSRCCHYEEQVMEAFSIPEFENRLFYLLREFQDHDEVFVPIVIILNGLIGFKGTSQEVKDEFQRVLERKAERVRSLSGEN